MAAAILAAALLVLLGAAVPAAGSPTPAAVAAAESQETTQEPAAEPAQAPAAQPAHEATVEPAEPAQEATAEPAGEAAEEPPPEPTAGQAGEAGEDPARLTDERIPLAVEGFPKRPRPLLELGAPFLGTGTLKPGFELPTGAVWQPSLLLFGTYRTALQSFQVDGDRVAEWANRLDLFANLQLTGTERLVVGFRPLDQDGRFTSYTFRSDVPGIDEGSQNELNGEVTSVFFEGDFGEIFPNLSKRDFKETDVGFSVGRQPLLFQEGLLIDDTVDGIGLTRNTLQPHHTSNFRSTLFWGWNEVGRAGLGGNREDDSAQLFALLTSTDLPTSTVDADLVYVASDTTAGDLISGGVSAVQRIGKLNTSFRVLGSRAVDQETPFSTDGVLLFSEVSYTPAATEDLFYVTTFWAIDEFSSAARGPASGGPLGRAGINFAAVGLGRAGAPLSSRARDVAGGAVGYQRFFSHTRRQLILELGGRLGTAGGEPDSLAGTARYQTAMGQHYVLVIDGFAGYRQGPGTQDLFGGRVELLVKF
jgi:hypothetical protein